jgi:hypothetical protein
MYSDKQAFTTTIPSLENVTEKYKFISTAQFIEDVQSFGYSMVKAVGPKHGLGKHWMSFSHPDLKSIPGTELRIGATNAHDGSAAFTTFIEMLELVCTNGLVAHRTQAEFRVVHRGYAIDKVKAALDETRHQVGAVVNQVQLMKNTQVDALGVFEFIQSAKQLREVQPLNAGELTKARHRLQAEDTAWNVFNRAQEALIKGGYRTLNLDTGKEGSRAREVKAVSEQLRINKQLWKLAAETLIK